MSGDLPFAAIQRGAGGRATLGRAALLRALVEADKPMSPAELARLMRRRLNRVNVYRALAAFEKAGLVRKVDLKHQHAHYEYVNPREHHHHLVCEVCGAFEDVDVPDAQLERGALRSARRFASVRSHTLEFFGLCKACA
ncbi:MAG: transcriptional repressor [Patescibacteria group bacterium]|nr:transcriptional repressor [Patescibacteria group bacterium]